MTRRYGPLVLLRHGESEWNLANRFTGWVDVELTARGEAEAAHAGALMRRAGLAPDALHTSVLTRAVRTGEITLRALGRSWIPVQRSWRLNERHYGALQGLDKADVRRRYGDEQFTVWRRSYDVPPPPLDATQDGDPADDPRYADVTPDLLPRTECLADVVRRLLPYWHDVLVPQLRCGRTLLVVAHGNSLRALVAHLDQLGPAEVVGLNIPTGIPLRYDLDERWCPTVPGGEYLDPQAARDAAAVVAAQGR